MYEIFINRQAKKKLQSLSSVIRTNIAEQIYRLGLDPDDVRLDIKKLRGPRGDVYK